MYQFGIIGNPLEHSFSPQFFETYFREHSIPAHYSAYPLQSIRDLPQLFQNISFSGLNVTSPYKEAVIPFLDGLSEEASEIGAVNVIAFQNAKKVGYNTDYIGFLQSIKQYADNIGSALILGTGGAAKAVGYALDILGIPKWFVSRHANPAELIIDYEAISDYITHKTLLVNCTPIGMFPNTQQVVSIPYHLLSKSNICYDLIYNPAETPFLRLSKQHGATAINGLQMLQQQALAAWEIWRTTLL